MFRAGEADVGLRAPRRPAIGTVITNATHSRAAGRHQDPSRFTGGTVTCASTSLDELEPSPDIGDLLRETGRDPIAIFWG